MEVCKYKRCNTKFEYSYKQTGRQRFCSAKCREACWRENNRERDRELKKRYSDKQFRICKLKGCNNIIPKKLKQKHFCSDKCKKIHTKIIQKRYREVVFRKFNEYKVNTGCSRCGYNKCGAALDFHHEDASKKGRRITAKMWYYNSIVIQKELEKCILICKNCHAELHHGSFGEIKFKGRGPEQEENSDV